MNPLNIDGLTVSADSSCFVVAEVGVNHNGSEELAHQLILAAADAGADAVKFQSFHSEKLATPSAPKAQYQAAAGGSDQSQLEMVQKLELPVESMARLRNTALDRGLIFFSTPFDVESAIELVDLGMPVIKVGSGDLTNHLLLSQLSDLGKPIILSTGMATLDEVRASVALISERVPALALLHCLSSYPAPVEDINLRAMETLMKEFGVPVGFSDHTTGIQVALAAVAMGARIVEKHLTLDRGMEGPDHVASIEPETFADMVSGIRLVETAMGDGIKSPKASEIDVRRVARRSLYISRPIEQGEQIGFQDLVALRPGDGLSSDRVQDVVGSVATRPLGVRHKLEESDYE